MKIKHWVYGKESEEVILENGQNNESMSVTGSQKIMDTDKLYSEEWWDSFILSGRGGADSNDET